METVMTKRMRSQHGSTTLAVAQAACVAVCWLMVGCQIEVDAGPDAAAPPLPVPDGSVGPLPMDAGLPSGTGPSDAAAPQPDAGLTQADAGLLRDAALPPRDAALPPRDDAAVATDGGTAFEQLAQHCVDTLNAYRATLGIAPLRRATPEQEACSNRGAEKDGKANSPHSSAGECRGLGAQNSCPGWGFGPRTPYASLSAALDGCLASMWAEGPPPVPVSACISDYLGCFMKHGHYINMVDTSNQVVACGFFDMGRDKFWMNQDFGR
jgi:hypothetical protein